VGDPLAALNDHERRVLAAFRERYEFHLKTAVRDSADANDGDNDDEEKKDSSSSHQQSSNDDHEPTKPNSLPLQPTYTLPPSGLRPLDDVTLYRYLLSDRHHKHLTFHPETSLQRLLSALRFRQTHQADLIVRNLASSSPTDIPPSVLRCQTLRIAIWAGRDRHHRPVVFERLGQFFQKGHASAATFEEWMESYLYFLERHFVEMRRAAEATGRPVQRIVYFADFQGVVSSILNRKIWTIVPLLKHLVRTVECHYPEIVDHIILFNVPRMASAAYNVVKGFLDPVTAEKIELFAGVPLERFRECMGEEVIPKEYGGRNEMEYPQTGDA